MNFISSYISFMTLLRKEIDRFLRIWSQTILPPAISMVLYFVIFGNLVGSQVRPINGYTYMQYIAPGLIMMSVVMNAYSNVVSSFFGARFQKSIEEIIVSPMPNSLMLLGFVVGGIARAIIVGLVVTVLALFFTRLHLQHPLLVFVTVVLASSLFSILGFLNGLFAKKFDDVTIIPTFVLTPLTYLGGVFYSINMLPPFWQKVSLFNPILYIVNAFRYGILGITDIPVLHSVLIMCIFVVALFILSWYLLEKGVGIRT